MPKMRRAQAIAKFEAACELLREISAGGYEFYVANTTLHLMSGPSHTADASRPLHQNSVASASAGIRISGGDW